MYALVLENSGFAERAELGWHAQGLKAVKLIYTQSTLAPDC